MAGDTFGQSFRVTSWGESHGSEVGALLHGCPAGVSITEADIQRELDRRRPGQSHLVTPRKESDRVEIVSGVYEGRTTGSPIALRIANQDARSADYDELARLYRPSHADYTYSAKYGHRDPRGGGRSSARITAGWVAAGAVARCFLPQIEVVAFVTQIGSVKAEVDTDLVKLNEVDDSLVRCPVPAASDAMIQEIEEVRRDGDSVGGIIGCVCRGVGAGLGEPVFDKLEADLAKAMLAINATKGFEIGSGFGAAGMRGRVHNDELYLGEDGEVRTRGNQAGGIVGGISNGMPLVFRVAFKPTATIASAQQTLDSDHAPTVLKARGRHDPCVLPRAVPIVEAMAYLVIADHTLRHRATAP